MLRSDFFSETVNVFGLKLCGYGNRGCENLFYHNLRRNLAELSKKINDVFLHEIY